MSVRAGIYYPDLSAGATITLTAGSTAAGYSLTDMQDANLSTTWKSGTTASGFTQTWDLGSSVSVSCVAILGHNLYSARNAGSSFSRVTISHSTDNVTYTVVHNSTSFVEDRIASDLPIIVSFPTVTARYVRIIASDPNTSTAYAYEIADVFIGGTFLDIVEPTGLPFTLMDLKMASRTGGSATGMGIPSVSGYVTHKVKLEIGPQAIGVSDFFNDTIASGDYPLTHAAPSFQHFIRNCWSLGLRFLFCPFTTGDSARYGILSWSAGNHTATCVSGDLLIGATSGAQARYLSTHSPLTGAPIAAGSMRVRGYDGTPWVVGEIVENFDTIPANHVFASYTSPEVTQFQWPGASICRAPHGTAKTSSPFAFPTRRKWSIEFDSTAEWCMR